ncbi:thermonuclease family protein [Candidatus Gottesmanbacteria bacterium]|nr:thermonuclease family protein [Candidatus Gottesmanbacteria bacterium]
MTIAKRNRKLIFNLQLVLFTVSIIIVFGLILWQKTSRNLPLSNLNPISPVITPTLILEKLKVKYVIDGDTIILSDNSKVRYIGINSPEIEKDGKMECFAQNAKNFNRQLVENQTVSLEKDISDKDKYGRLLRYVYLDGTLINEILVSQGFAKADYVPPDRKYAAIFKQAQEDARLGNRGLWKACN